MGLIPNYLIGLIKRIRGSKHQKKLLVPILEGDTFPDDLIIDSSELTEKSREEIDLEKAVELVERGGTPEEIASQFIYLTPAQIDACISLAEAYVEPRDISYVGGTKAVIDRIIKEAVERNRRGEYVERTSPIYTPRGRDIIYIMTQEKMQEERKENFRIQNPDRMPLLTLLYDSANALVSAESKISEQAVIKNARKSWKGKIDLKSKATGIQEVDVIAAIKLAYAVSKGDVKLEQLKEVGGPANIIDEMSVTARLKALDASSLNKAGEFLENPKEVIRRMPKEVVIKENLRFL